MHARDYTQSKKLMWIWRRKIYISMQRAQKKKLLGKFRGVVRASVEALRRCATRHAAGVGEGSFSWCPPRIEFPDVLNRARHGVDVGSAVLGVEGSIHFQRVEPGRTLVRAVVEVGQARAVAIGGLATYRDTLREPKAALSRTALGRAVSTVTSIGLNEPRRWELAVRPGRKVSVN